MARSFVAGSFLGLLTLSGACDRGGAKCPPDRIEVEDQCLLRSNLDDLTPDAATTSGNTGEPNTGGTTGGDSGTNTTGPAPECSASKPCTGATLSKCGAGGSCEVCQVSEDCKDITGKTACVKGVGCFECTQDNDSACNLPNDVCHATMNKCVECSATKQDVCDKQNKVCEPNTGTCVDCIDNSKCTTLAAPHCDTTMGKCTTCDTDDECAKIDGTKPYCDKALKACVACKGNADCKSPIAAKCDTSVGQCTGCSTNTDCGSAKDGSLDLPYCVNQECVQCTRTQRDRCGANDVCNALSHRCDANRDLHSKTVCNVCAKPTDADCQARPDCVSDDECQVGQRCVNLTYNPGSGDVPAGRYCMWISGSSGANPDCTNAGRPFVASKTLGSIDGAGNATVCTHSVTTCDAYNAFRKSCGKYAPTGVIVSNWNDSQIPAGDRGKPATAAAITATDSACGLGGKCVTVDNTTGQYACSFGCGDDKDCKTSFTCSVASGTLCSLNL